MMTVSTQLVWVWPALMVAGIVAFVWGVAGARAATRAERSTGVDRAHQILQERFARGEITERELRERTRILDER